MSLWLGWACCSLSHTLSRCNQAPLSLHCHFHCCDFHPVPQRPPDNATPPSLPTPPSFLQHPTSPLQIQWVPICSKEKRSRQTRCVNCKPPQFGLISMKEMSSCSPQRKQRSPWKLQIRRFSQRLTGAKRSSLLRSLPHSLFLLYSGILCIYWKKLYVQSETVWP